MELIAQYPVAAEHVVPHKGRAVAAMLPDGDIVCGVIECVHDGHLVMRPLDGVPEAVVAGLKRQLAPQLKNRKAPSAKIKAYGGGYPFGWGYGSYAWGTGWWWIWPLFALTALAFLPFFFI